LRGDFDLAKLGSHGRSLHSQSNGSQYWSRCGTIRHEKLVVNLTGPFSLSIVLFVNPFSQLIFSTSSNIGPQSESNCSTSEF
jgi:hypothetical protein